MTKRQHNLPCDCEHVGRIDSWNEGDRQHNLPCDCEHVGRIDSWNEGDRETT